MKNLIYKSAAMTFAVIALFLAAATSTQAQTEREIREMIPEREQQISKGCEGARVAIEVVIFSLSKFPRRLAERDLPRDGDGFYRQIITRSLS